jgi:hypothetical protein
MVERSAEWWLRKLTDKLDKQISATSKWAKYFDGTQPLSFATASYKVEFETMIKAVSDNWMPLLCEAVNERMHIDGFRFGQNPKADDDAWRIWQLNGLDSDSELLHLDALKYGTSAVMVWRDEGTDQPIITVEHPHEVYVAHAPGTARERIAAIKRWNDEWSEAKFTNIYLPDATLKFMAEGEAAPDLIDVIENPLGVVPVVAFRNRMDTWGNFRSELDGFTSTQDQINKLLADMMVASEYGAFRQRWATGLEVPTDPQTGKAKAPFQAAINRLWVSPDENTRFGDFDATDLKHYIDAITSRIQSLASRSRTPPHYLLASGVFPNGESTKAAETGLISKVRSRQRAFGEAWEDTLRLAFAMIDDPRQDEVMAETIWADPESRTESEHMDALIKQMALGVPKEALWSEAGYSPTEIARFKLMLQQEALRTAMAAPLLPIAELGPGTNARPATDSSAGEGL